jgi:gluconolactonase
LLSFRAIIAGVLSGGCPEIRCGSHLNRNCTPAASAVFHRRAARHAWNRPGRCSSVSSNVQPEGIMRASLGISRRSLLEMAALGGVAAATGTRGALAQPSPAKRIEKLAPELDAIIATSEPIRVLAEGYGGDQGPAEGPVWWKEGGYLLFSDINGNRRIKYMPGQGASVFKEGTNRANGLTRDLQGRLVVCEAEAQRVTRLEADGSTTVIANNYQGKRLGRPNDVIVKSDGSIYFTDPGLRVPLAEREQETAAVIRVKPDGSVSKIADFEYPNGLAFSPDERVLYVANTRFAMYIHAIELDSAGNMVRRRIFADMSSDETEGVPDGMKVDVEGRVYCTGPGGTWVFAPSGEKLGVIKTPEVPANLCFGGSDLKTLFFTGRTSIYSLRVKVPGQPHPWYKRYN